MNIKANQEQFLEDMTSLKNDLINSLNSESVEKYREIYKGRYSPERFKEFFIEKTVLHKIFKYVLIRMIEESMARVKVKLNESGMKNWQEMSKNFREDYYLLLEFAESDVKREKDLAEIFKEAIFDESQFTSKTKNVMNNHIPVLAKYDFSSLNANTSITLIDNLYDSEKRDELQDFYQQSHVINFLLQQVGLM